MLTCQGVPVEVRGQPPCLRWCLFRSLFLCPDYPALSLAAILLALLPPCHEGAKAARVWPHPASYKFFGVKIRSWWHGKDIHPLSHLQTASYFLSPSFPFLFFQNPDVTNVRSLLVSRASGPPVSTSLCVSCCPKRLALIICFQISSSSCYLVPSVCCWALKLLVIVVFFFSVLLKMTVLKVFDFFARLPISKCSGFIPKCYSKKCD